MVLVSEVLHFNVALSRVKQGLSATYACTGYYAGWITELPGLCKFLHREWWKDQTRTGEESRRHVPARICQSNRIDSSVRFLLDRNLSKITHRS